MGMPDTAKRLHKETNQDLINDEVEAVENYDKAINESDNPDDIATYEHIKGEEEEHIEELEGLDKMKADEITSEQAWEDFKAGYSDFKEKHVDKDIQKGRDGDQASMEEKIDILSAKISELNTDMSRLTDSVPQALGTIEEGKTLEEEAEENDEASEDGDLFGGEDDGLGEYFDDEEGGEEFLGEEGMSDEDTVDDEDGESMDDELTDDEEFGEEDSEDVEIADDEEAVEDENIVDGEEVSDESDEGSDSEDEDYISIDEIDSEDEGMESEESEEEVSDEEVAETEEEEDDVEKALAKMVKVLEKMDKRITILERENVGLKKQLADRNTVQTEPRNVAKSRPVPNTNLRLVKGSYNRPPVSTQYVSNQRDIGIGKKKESSNTDVFHKGLNEVFAECNRIANQTL